MQNFITVPFKAESGLSQFDGMGKFSPAGIVLEFESKFLGFFKGGVQENRIALDEILDNYLHSRNDQVEKINMKSVYINYRFALMMAAKLDSTGCQEYK